MMTKLKPILFLLFIINLALIPAAILNFNAAAAPSMQTTDSYAYLPIIFSPLEPVPFGAVNTGEGTYYVEATGEGACMFPPSPENLMIAAMNETDYNTAELCGAYVQATGPKGTVIVRIVDMCPSSSCSHGNIDFSPEAFIKIADLAQGRVPISWQLVSYPLPDPIVYYFREGSDQYWMSLQIRNHTNPVERVEYQDAGGVFHEIERTAWNTFPFSGLGSGPFTFRVTDNFGNQLVDSVPLTPGGEVEGGGQFPVLGQ